MNLWKQRNAIRKYGWPSQAVWNDELVGLTKCERYRYYLCRKKQRLHSALSNIDTNPAVKRARYRRGGGAAREIKAPDFKGLRKGPGAFEVITALRRRRHDHEKNVWTLLRRKKRARIFGCAQCRPNSSFHRLGKVLWNRVHRVAPKRHCTTLTAAVGLKEDNWNLRQQEEKLQN